MWEYVLFGMRYAYCAAWYDTMEDIGECLWLLTN